MVETPPFPEKSLREAILNAVMHNDYGSGIPIQIRIWEDRMRIADNGGIPYNWIEEDLLEDHESVPVNPSLANVFFLAGLWRVGGAGSSASWTDTVIILTRPPRSRSAISHSP